MVRLWLLISFFVLLPNDHYLRVDAVDRSNFKTCEQASFCKRHRSPPQKSSDYMIDASSVVYNGTAIDATIETNVSRLHLSLIALDDGRLRVLIDQHDHTIRPRYQPLDALADVPIQKRFKSHTPGQGSSMLITADGNKVLLHYRPFRIDIYQGTQELLMSINSAGMLKFEHYKQPKAPVVAESWLAAIGRPFRMAADAARRWTNTDDDDSTVQEQQSNDDEHKDEERTTTTDDAKEEDDDTRGEETFKSHRDARPYGASSVGVDVSFIGYKFIYGLPEHADSFALKSTTYTDPYRLYNLDVFEYELNNPMALYGSIPYVIAHNPLRTVGFLWLNAAETWVDVNSSTADKGMLRTLVDKFRSSAETPQIDTHWISESGLIDMFIMLGPKPVDVFRQYTQLTGIYPLPPLFAIAYHQCRWNYNDMDDVADVHASFDQHDIPMDVIWLDIEHTDGKKYFTWDPIKFSDSKSMIDQLAAKSRKMITIVDPHLKKDTGYHVYKDAKDHDYFIKDRDGNDYEGHCWPGASMYLDFINPEVRQYWSGKFSFDQYVGSTPSLFIWNDMNEPSVFSGPEITMHKDAKHYGGWEHRDVHNAYGFYHHSSTYKGLLARSNNEIRPFLLTRAFFVGSQRTAAIWTGDNIAEWSHLKMSIPMCLSISIAGVPLVGADVGGFFRNPDEELLTRWYQAGAFLPFFRAHAHIDTRRREPWLFSENTKLVIRAAIRRRYALLPYWYTLFYEHTLTGLPVMRPLWLEFPEEETGFDEEREYLIGSGLLVRPVVEAGATSVSLYLPGSDVIWYDWDTHKGRPGPGAIYVDTPIDKIPVYQRGGTIIPVRERIRRASKLMLHDPFTLYIGISYKGDSANGTLYMDDGETFAHTTSGEYLYRSFEYRKEGDTLYSIFSKNLDPNGKLTTVAWIERIHIRGIRYYPRDVHIFVDDYVPEKLDFTHDRDAGLLTIRKPAVNVMRDFRIDIHA